MQWTRAFLISGVFGLLISVLGMHPAHGQEIGLVGGLNYSSLRNVEFDDLSTTFNNRAGYHFGAYVEIGENALSVRPGFRFMRAGKVFRGLREDLGDENVAFDDDFNVDVIAVPIDLLLELPVPFLSPYIFGGPELRFRSFPDAPDELEDDLRESDIAGAIGAGIRFTVPNQDFSILPEVRYIFGLTSTMDDTITVGDRELNPNESLTLRMFMVSIGFEF